MGAHRSTWQPPIGTADSGDLHSGKALLRCPEVSIWEGGSSNFCCLDLVSLVELMCTQRQLTEATENQLLGW